MSYAAFLRTKEPGVETAGISEPGYINPLLYPFQADIVRWALRLGRAAIFADCGLGKTLMQLEWACQASDRTLIVAPIAVGRQTIEEAERLGLAPVEVERPHSSAWLQVTNYEKLHHFVGASYGAIVLDESSILKSLDGKTRGLLLKEFAGIPRRLCCTATPAPNDVSELANHAQFLGAMTRAEMLATFFVHDSDGKKGDGVGWRLKGHAADALWRWMAKWSVYVRRPSDLGYADEGFALPPLEVRDEVVASDWKPDGALFATGLGGVGARGEVRKHTLGARVAKAAQIIASDREQWIVWCGLNDEGRELAKALGAEAVLIEGSDSDEDKIGRERAWREGSARVLISKPRIFGFGMNWQHCSKMLFLGIGDSYEQYYQAIRRAWRFGQRRPVDVRIVVSDIEGEIAANVRAKERAAAQMAESVVAAMRDTQTDAVRGTQGRDGYEPAERMRLPEWVGA